VGGVARVAVGLTVRWIEVELRPWMRRFDMQAARSLHIKSPHPWAEPLTF